MHEPHDQPRTVMIAAAFCAIIGLIAYAGYLQNGWARSASTGDFHRAVMTGQQAPIGARKAHPDDSVRAVVTTK